MREIERENWTLNFVCFDNAGFNASVWSWSRFMWQSTLVLKPSKMKLPPPPSVIMVATPLFICKWFQAYTCIISSIKETDAEHMSSHFSGTFTKYSVESQTVFAPWQPLASLLYVPLSSSIPLFHFKGMPIACPPPPLLLPCPSQTSDTSWLLK